MRRSIYIVLLSVILLSTPITLCRSALAANKLRCNELLVDRLDTVKLTEYYAIKSEIDPEDKFLSLDNKNLAGTFYSKIPQIKTFEINKSYEELAGRLRANFKIPNDLHIRLGPGVRKLLGELFNSLSNEGYSVLLPEDNYPVYEQLAKQAGLEITRFRTVPTLSLKEKSHSGKQVLVITSPLSPIGRSLFPEEVQSIQDWLARDSSRRVVLDTVYTFDNQFDESTELLLKSRQVLAIHSYAKSYALPGHLGFAIGSSETFGTFLKQSNSINYDLASKALAIAQAHPSFPEQIRLEISARWTALTPQIQRILPDWTPPENSYYSVVPISTAEILQKHGIWTFPLATFGSEQTRYSVISALPEDKENVFYVTVLSNFARAFDKYSMSYSKTGIPESTFPNQFYLLNKSELQIGIEKTQDLLKKTMRGDRILVLKTSEKLSQLNPNERNGRGRFVRTNSLRVENLFYLNSDGSLAKSRLEDVYSDSLSLNSDKFVPIEKIRPRSISILPIAKACQACCKFCFSEASISAEKRLKSLSIEDIESAFKLAQRQGAERAVITGGGEPTLIGFEKLNEMVKIAVRYFPKKVTLITNGITLSKLEPIEIKKELLRLQSSGASVLAISRHHQNADKNAFIMGKDTQTEKLLRVYNDNREEFSSLKLRLICVLQKPGVNSEQEIADYISWARNQGVFEINFKELYVSNNRESNYSSSPFNVYSEDNRIYLKTVLNFASREGWTKTGELPWGAPIFEKTIDGMHMKIAAYTEPSLFWERTHGIARSWNLMADGKLMMSLENGDTEIEY